MNKKVIIFIVLFFIGGTYLHSQSLKLKVMTFNVLSMEPDFNVQPHIQLINEEKPDLISYQEVETRTSRMNKRDLILEIANATGMFLYFAPAYIKDEGEYGNAILSKYPIIASEYKELPIYKEQSGSDQRVALISRILFPNNQELNFLAIHLDHRINADYTYKQLEPALTKDLLDENIPMIMAGDFNTYPGSPFFQKITEKFDRNDKGTFVDFIFTYPKNKWKMIESKVLYDVMLSDHEPVISLLEYKK